MPRQTPLHAALNDLWVSRLFRPCSCAIRRQDTSRRAAACYALLLQESKEALERLRRMGAYEAQDFDVTVSLASAAHGDCPRGCASAYSLALDEPGFTLLCTSSSRLAEPAKSFCSHVLEPADAVLHMINPDLSWCPCRRMTWSGRPT